MSEDSYTPAPLKDESASVPPKEPVSEQLPDGAKGTTRKAFSLFQHLFIPRSEGDGAEVSRAPGWLNALCALAMFFMMNQVKLPVLGGRLALGDFAFLAAFIPVFVYYLVKRRRFFYPLLGLLVLLVAGVANILSASGMGGAVETAQLVQMLLCGTMLLGVLIENAPWLCGIVLVVAVGCNLALGLTQCLSFGFGSALAPADVLAQRWGIGGAYAGLFRSRMAYSFFLAMAIAWLQPVLNGRRSCLAPLISFLAMVVALVAIPHGQMAFIVCAVLLVGGFMQSQLKGLLTVLALAVALGLSVFILPSEHHKTQLDTLYPLKSEENAGELKTNHIDAVAALKMASRLPWYGVGSGRYQQCVGCCYEELPNPSWNDIDSDTQASWGILAGTMGWAAAGAMMLLLLSSIGRGVRRYYQSQGANRIALGGALALAVALLGMFVSDPLTRGLGWMLALALASCYVPYGKEKMKGDWWRSAGMVIVAGIVLAGLLAVCALRAKAENPLQGASSAVLAQAADKKADVMAESVYLIIDAEQVASFTPPVEKGTDSMAAKNSVLKIQDGKGTPPDGKEPAMEYGGAIFNFQVPADCECKVWLRVWWDGSCGNTINVKMDDEEKSTTVGNDGTYRSWHWLEAPRTYKLAAGKHVITLLNREDGIMFDQMVITNDFQTVPQGIEE